MKSLFILWEKKKKKKKKNQHVIKMLNIEIKSVQDIKQITEKKKEATLQGNKAYIKHKN